ncbi:MAG: DUF4037 domain-containing protein [Chloroflexi bacterium]|nr:DUF4037 domain-containing protein [Chloroflexota bacterium]
MPAFVHGIELNRRFYLVAVRPILEAHFPSLPYAAAHIGSGSDVLGFDDEMSTDHEWGPSLRIFLRDEDAHLANDIREMLRQHLPHVFCGYPVGVVAVLDEPGIHRMQMAADGPVNHRVCVTTVCAAALRNLGYDVNQPPTAADWLTFPTQKLRELTAGAVYYDGVGELTRLRERLAWYPRDVWLYLLAAGWQRIGQEEHLMPRAGFVGDEMGAAIIGSRLVRDVMSICFLMEKQYAPYPKWFGTAFKQLKCAADLTPILWRAQMASTWREREDALCEAYEYLARTHNRLGITPPLPAVVSSFHDRPFRVIHSDLFANSIVEQISDPEVRRIASRRLIGNIDQWSDSTDIRSDAVWRPIVRQLYQP